MEARSCCRGHTLQRRRGASVSRDKEQRVLRDARASRREGQQPDAGVPQVEECGGLSRIVTLV